MTDEELLCYALAHSRTDVAMFSREHTKRLFAMADIRPPTDLDARAFWQIGDELAKTLVDAARKKAARDVELAFAETVRRVTALGDRAVADVAERLSVSAPTVKRWACGQSVPHEVIRTHVVDCIKRYLEAR